MNLAATATEMQIRPGAPILFKGSFVESFPAIAGAGYDAVEAHIHNSAEFDRPRLSRLLAENGLGLAGIGTGSAYGKDGLSLSNPDDAVRENAVKRIQAHVDTASEYSSAVVILGLIRGWARECSSREEYEGNLQASLEKCLVYAERRQVTLVLEMVNRYEADAYNSIIEGMALLTQLPSPRLQLHLDTFHMNIEEADIPQAIASAAGHIGHVHIADSNRLYPGSGHYDFAATLGALHAIGYNGALSVECMAGCDAVQAAAACAEHIRPLLNGLKQGKRS